MDWVKLAVNYFDDERIEALDDAAEVMFVRGIARAGKVARGGFIPESSLPKLARRRRYETLVEKLVESGLWTRVTGGVQVTNWSDWQDALDILAERRTADRERKRRKRAEQREVDAVHKQLSADSPRTVRPLEEEGDLERGSLRGDGYVPARASESPPPTRYRCKRHTHLADDNPGPPCVACRDARLAAQSKPDEQAKPHWCGDCNEHTRQIELDDGRPARCPTCHPLRSVS